MTNPQVDALREKVARIISDGQTHSIGWSIALAKAEDILALTTPPQPAATVRAEALERHIRDFLLGLDRGYFHCDKTEFVEAMRREVTP